MAIFIGRQSGRIQTVADLEEVLGVSLIHLVSPSNPVNWRPCLPISSQEPAIIQAGSEFTQNKRVKMFLRAHRVVGNWGPVIFVGSPAEKPYLEELASALGGGVAEVLCS